MLNLQFNNEGHKILDNQLLYCTYMRHYFEAIVQDSELDKLQARFNKLRGIDVLPTMDELQARFDKLAGVEKKTVSQASRELMEARMLLNTEMHFSSHSTDSLVKCIDNLMQANRNALAATMGKIDPESLKLRALVGSTVKLMEQAKNHLVEENELNLPLRQKTTVAKQSAYEVLKELNQANTTLNKVLHLPPHKAVSKLQDCIADYKKALHNAAETITNASYLSSQERFKIVTVAERHKGFLERAQKTLEHRAKELLIDEVKNIPSPPTGFGARR